MKPRKVPVRKNPAKEKWEDVRPELYVKFIDAGIVGCELNWTGCTEWTELTFAHSLRRGKIAKYTGKEHAKKMREVIRACISCHKKLDALPHKHTYKIVNDIIADRPVTV